VTLRWSAPADCPTEVEVLDEITRLLGARSAPNEHTFDVGADVTRKDDGTYVVRLEIPAADGARLREVSAVSCAALGQATALILAMMVDPEATLTAAPAPVEPPEPPPGQTAPQQVDPGQTQPKPEPSDTSHPVPTPLGKAPRSPPPKDSVSNSPMKKPPQARRPQFSGALHLRGDIGSLPGPAFGIGAALGILPGRLRFEFGGAYFVERRGALSALPQSGADVGLWSFHATGGAAIYVHPKIEVTPRIQFEVGRMAASSFGVSKNDQGAGITVGLGVGGLASVQITRNLYVGIGLDGLALLAYPRFIVTGVGVAHEPSWYVGRITLEAAWRF